MIYLLTNEKRQESITRQSTHARSIADINRITTETNQSAFI